MAATHSGAVDRIKQRNGIEVADIFRHHINDYREKYRMPAAHMKVVGDILTCRTAYLGGHVERCDNCHAENIAYNSCRNRHCPKCPIQQIMQRLIGEDISRCPHCKKGTMRGVSQIPKGAGPNSFALLHPP